MKGLFDYILVFASYALPFIAACVLVLACFYRKQAVLASGPRECRKSIGGFRKGQLLLWDLGVEVVKKTVDPECPDYPAVEDVTTEGGGHTMIKIRLVDGRFVKLHSSHFCSTKL